jgi:hypothetical protein
MKENLKEKTARPKPEEEPRSQGSMWTYQSDDTSVLQQAGPLEVQLHDQSIEVWEKPQAHKGETGDVLRWRQIPKGLWATR